MNPMAFKNKDSKVDNSAALAQAQPKAAGVGLPTPTQQLKSGIQQVSAQQPANMSFPNSVTQHVSVGQSEVAAWYRDSDEQHLAMAKTHFEEAIRQAPSHPEAHHGLAIIADLQEQYPLAELHYQKALSVNPNNAKVLGDLGYSYLLQGRLNEAEAFLTRTIETDATNQNAIKHLGDVYAQQGRIDLAKTTYAAVLNPQETAVALAENSKPVETEIASTEEKPSFLEKMMPKKKEELNPTEEIRQLMVKEREKRAEDKILAQASAQHSQSQMNQPPAQGYVPHYFSEEEQLKRNLTRIDREEYQGTANGPIVIDPRNNNQMAQAFPQSQQGYSQQQGYQPQQGYSPQQGYQPQQGNQNYAQQTQQVFGQPAFEQQGQFTNGPFNNNSMAQQPGFQGQGNQQPFAQNTQQNMASANGQPVGNPYFNEQAQQQPLASSPQNSGREPFQPVQNAMTRNLANQRSQEPWQGIQPAAAESPVPDVNHAQHLQNQYPQNQQPQQPASTPQTNQAQQLSSVPPQWGMNQGGGNPNGPSQQPNLAQQPYPQSQSEMPPANGGNSYEEASKAAARMGMGMGAGTVFPVFQQNTNRMSPGSDTRNGTSFNAPQRFLPTELPPQDLNQAYAPGTQQYATPANSHGQRMPSSTPAMFSQEQFGTASRYQPSSMNTGNMPQLPTGANYDHNSTHQSYDDQRQQLDNQHNNTIQQAWGVQQMPQGVTPAGGSHQLAAPAVYGGMMTPLNGESYNINNSQPINSQPPSWPHQTQQPNNQQTNRPYSNSYQGETVNGNNYNPNVVVPQPYPGAVQQQHQPTSQYAPQQNYNAPLNAPQRQLRDNYQPYDSSNGLPMIVPGNR